MRRLLFIVIYSTVFVAFAQDNSVAKYANTITKSDLEDRLAVLAADSLEGRETGKSGQKKAARYIAQKFEEFGLKPPVSVKGKPSYFQPFPLIETRWHEVYLRKGEERKVNFEDFIYFSNTETQGEEIVDLIYVGDNLDSSLDVSEKYVVISNKNMGRNWQLNVSFYQDLGAAGYFISNQNSDELRLAMARFKPFFSQSTLTLADEAPSEEEEKIVVLDTVNTAWIFEKPFFSIQKGDKAQVILNADKHKFRIQSENVLGYIEGMKKPNELLVITSHYDHLGIIDGEIYNGADDDGSGTTSVMEIAEAFSTAVKNGRGPARSVLFMCVSGEEKGLLGSDYYTQNPVFPLENTITNLNIDMVGRVDQKHKGNPYYIYIIGSDKLSRDLHQLSEKVNEQTVNIEFDYTYNDENDPNRFYYRSDHYNFAKNDIPVIFYFNGTHEDYHKPTDTIEKIHFDKMRKIAQLIFYTAWEITNRKEKIEVDIDK